MLISGKRDRKLTKQDVEDASYTLAIHRHKYQINETYISI